MTLSSKNTKCANCELNENGCTMEYISSDGARCIYIPRGLFEEGISEIHFIGKTFYADCHTCRYQWNLAYEDPCKHCVKNNSRSGYKPSRICITCKYVTLVYPTTTTGSCFYCSLRFIKITRREAYQSGCKYWEESV